MPSFKMTSSPSCSNDAAQSDDEEKLQSQPTDTDGGRLKQKTWVTVLYIPFLHFKLLFKKYKNYFRYVLYPAYTSVYHHHSLPLASKFWVPWGCAGHFYNIQHILNVWDILHHACIIYLKVGTISVSRRMWSSLKLPFPLLFISADHRSFKPNYTRFFLTTQCILNVFFSSISVISVVYITYVCSLLYIILKYLLILKTK